MQFPSKERLLADPDYNLIEHLLNHEQKFHPLIGEQWEIVIAELGSFRLWI